MRFIYKGKTSKILRWKMLFNINYQVITDTLTAYTKAVPHNAVCGNFKKIGGSTIVDANKFKSAVIDKIIIGNIEKAIPAAVQALDGYGLSAGNASNTIEWAANGKIYYHKRVTSVDLGTLTWAYVGSAARKFFYATVSENSILYDGATAQNALCEKYGVTNGNGIYYNRTDKTFCMSTSLLSSANDRVYVYDTDFTDATVFKAAMDGVMLNYELAEEVIIDITEYFAQDFDNFVTQENDTITFHNTLGLELPVPNEIEYIVYN